MANSNAVLVRHTAIYCYYLYILQHFRRTICVFKVRCLCSLLNTKDHCYPVLFLTDFVCLLVPFVGKGELCSESEGAF